jgi:hypothetical protein
VYPLAEFGQGVSMGGDFPFADTGDYAFDKLWLWVEKGSYANFEVVSRFPIIGLWFILNLLAIDSVIMSKLLIILGFVISSFSFYFAFIFVFKDRLRSLYERKDEYLFSEGTKLRVAAVVGSLFFAYNVWSFHRIAHWYLWIGYAVLPLFFCSIFYAFRYPRKWKFILFSVLLWSLASATPHMTIFYGIVFIFTFILYASNYLLRKQDRKKTLNLGVPLLSIVLIYILLNLYWIYPYILAQQTRAVSPDYLLVMENLEMLSRDSNFFNTFRIVADWLGSQADKPSEDSPFYTLWFSSTFLTPVFAFSTSLFVRKSLRKYTLILSFMAAIGIVLAMGTNSPLGYYQLILATPILTNYVWVFRDPDKWSFLIAFSYSFLIGIGSYRILELTDSLKKIQRYSKPLIVCLFLFLVIGSLCVSSAPVYLSIIHNKLLPISFPSEFDGLNSYLAKTEIDKIFFMPSPSDETVWNTRGQAGGIYHIHSNTPSIESIGIANRNYYNHLVWSLMENKSQSIGNFLYPLGTAFVAFHNDTWNSREDFFNTENIALLKRLYGLADFEHEGNIGFFNIFKTISRADNNANLQVNIPLQNFAIIGGLDLLNPLNVVNSYSSSNSNIVFFNDLYTNKFMGFDKLIVNGDFSSLDVPLSYLDPKYMVDFSSKTVNYDPLKTWSKSGAKDPMDGNYQEYLRQFGIENWEFDYGRGLALTQATGANISVPIQFTENSELQVFLRYLESQRGGVLRIYLDGQAMGEINTFDNSNKYVWKKIIDTNSPLSLGKGNHILTVENVKGFNSINILAVLPQAERDRLNGLKSEVSNKSDIVYILEAEEDFNQFPTNGNLTLDPRSSLPSMSHSMRPANYTFSGQFKTDMNNDDIVSLIISTSNNSGMAGPFTIRNLKIFPTEERTSILISDFERKGQNISLAELRQTQLMPDDEDKVYGYTERKAPLSGNASLGVKILKGKTADQNGWAILSTDLVPIHDNTIYSYQINISASDVHQLHMKMVYYDVNKKRMDYDTTMNAKDGTYQDSVFASILPPKGAKYMRAEILASPVDHKESLYLIDDMRIQEIYNKDNLAFEESYDEYYMSIKGDSEMDANSSIYLPSSNTKESYTVRTKPFALKGDTLYNYTLTIEGENQNLRPVAYLASSENANENASRHISGASGGETISLNPGDQLYTDIEVLKESNYTIAFRAKACFMCKDIEISMTKKEPNAINEADKAPLNDELKIGEYRHQDRHGFQWLYLNDIYLEPGRYEIIASSDSRQDIDLAVIYSADDRQANLNKKVNSWNPLDIFPSKVDAPAYIADYKRIEPTRSVLNISNATSPYILSFSETFDPLWSATIHKIQSNGTLNQSKKTTEIESVPLFSIINGFPIDITGDYELTIEYRPQVWFLQAGTLSLATLILVLAFTFVIFLSRKYRIGRFLPRVDVSRRRANVP